MADFGETPEDLALIDHQTEFKVFRKMLRRPVEIKMIYLGKAMKEFLVTCLHDNIRKCWYKSLKGISKLLRL